MNSNSNKSKRERKDAQGYRKVVHPKCFNCRSYGPMQRGYPATDIQPAVPYIAPHCTIGNFAVDPDAVCNEYAQRTEPRSAPSMNPGLLEDTKPVRFVPRLAGEYASF
jgi:hypothetical protein